MGAFHHGQRLVVVQRLAVVVQKQKQEAVTIQHLLVPEENVQEPQPQELAAILNHAQYTEDGQLGVLGVSAVNSVEPVQKLKLEHARILRRKMEEVPVKAVQHRVHRANLKNVQYMVNGRHGKDGENATSPVEVDNNYEEDNVIVPPRNMAEDLVLAQADRNGVATPTTAQWMVNGEAGDYGVYAAKTVDMVGKHDKGFVINQVKSMVERIVLVKLLRKVDAETKCVQYMVDGRIGDVGVVVTHSVGMEREQEQGPARIHHRDMTDVIAQDLKKMKKPAN